MDTSSLTKFRAVQQPQITSSVETITPETAAHWLNNNNSLNPRPISALHVGRLADDFKVNGYPMTGESIILNANGEILDGQHRLAAIVKAGITAQVLVVRGVPNAAREVIDSRQRIRSLGDLLGGLGVKGAQNVAAIGRMAFMYCTEGQRSANRFVSGYGTNATSGKREMQSWIFKHRDILYEFNYLASECQRRQNLGGARFIAFGPTVSAMMSGETQREDAIRASREYLNGLSKMVDLADGDARLALLRYNAGHALVSGKNGPGSYREALLGVCTGAWNAWIEGRPLARVMRPKGNELSVTTFAQIYS